MFSNQFKPKCFTIFLLLSITNFLPINSDSKKSCRIIIRDQLAHPHNTRADQQISELKELSSCEILKLSSFQNPDNAKRPSYWTYTTVLNKLSEMAPDWTLFIEPHTILNAHNLKSILELSNNSENAENDENAEILHPTIYTNELIDEHLSIIHHFAGYKPEESHKKSFIDFARGFLVNKVMLEKLSEYQSTIPQNPQSFHIDAAHELSEFIDKALESDGNGARKWLKHSEVFKNINVKTFLDYNCGSSHVTEDDFLVAVKTAKHLHKDRLKIVLETWGLEFKNIKFFSNVSQSLFNGKIETTNTYNVPNTLKGHCGKTSAVIKNFDNKKYKFLVIVDDDTIFGKENLMKILNCYEETDGIFIGERYGFALGNKYSGYNYITGGGGMILSSRGVEIYKDKCECPSIESPDDMMISECLERNGVHMVHEPAFHQARPEDYTNGYLNAHGAVSFHKHWNCDPISIYQEWFSKAKHDEL